MVRIAMIAYRVGGASQQRVPLTSLTPPDHPTSAIRVRGHGQTGTEARSRPTPSALACLTVSITIGTCLKRPSGPRGGGAVLVDPWGESDERGRCWGLAQACGCCDSAVEVRAVPQNARRLSGVWEPPRRPERHKLRERYVRTRAYGECSLLRNSEYDKLRVLVMSSTAMHTIGARGRARAPKHHRPHRRPDKVEVGRS